RWRRRSPSNAALNLLKLSGRHCSSPPAHPRSALGHAFESMADGARPPTRDHGAERAALSRRAFDHSSGTLRVAVHQKSPRWGCPPPTGAPPDRPMSVDLRTGRTRLHRSLVIGLVIGLRRLHAADTRQRMGAI